LGLKPVQRRVWAQQAEPPIAAVKWRFQWLWLYGCVHPLVWGNILVDSTESQYRVIQPRRRQLLHNILAWVRTSVSFSFSIELVGRRARPSNSSRRNPLTISASLFPRITVRWAFVVSDKWTNCQSLFQVVGWARSGAIRALSTLASAAWLDFWFNFLSLVASVLLSGVSCQQLNSWAQSCNNYTPHNLGNTDRSIARRVRTPVFPAGYETQL